LQRSFKELPLIEDLRESGKLEIHINKENIVLSQNSNPQDLMMWKFSIIQAIP